MKKKITTVLLTLLLAFSLTVPVLAENGKVTYNGSAQEFIFEPGSEYSPTDLFPNFKDVMPGDTLTQKITVKNDASNKVKVKIYMRSYGAHENSVEFLSQLGLKVEVADDNTMGYMFDAAANETAQLTDWVCLGTLYSGGEVNLNVILNVPAELTNEYSNQIGYLDWEFMIEEYPIEESDPIPPKTGDTIDFTVYIVVIVLAVAVILIDVFWRRRKKDANN